MSHPVEFNFGDDQTWVLGDDNGDGTWTKEHTYSVSGQYVVTARAGTEQATDTFVATVEPTVFVSVDPATGEQPNATSVVVNWTGGDPGGLALVSASQPSWAPVTKTGDGTGTSSVDTNAVSVGANQVALADASGSPITDPLPFEVTAAVAPTKPVITAVTPNTGEISADGPISLTGTDFPDGSQIVIWHRASTDADCNSAIGSVLGGANVMPTSATGIVPAGIDAGRVICQVTIGTMETSSDPFDVDLTIV